MPISATIMSGACLTQPPVPPAMVCSMEEEGFLYLEHFEVPCYCKSGLTECKPITRFTAKFELLVVQSLQGGSMIHSDRLRGVIGDLLSPC